MSTHGAKQFSTKFMYDNLCQPFCRLRPFYVLLPSDQSIELFIPVLEFEFFNRFKHKRPTLPSVLVSVKPGTMKRNITASGQIPIKRQVCLITHLVVVVGCWMSFFDSILRAHRDVGEPASLPEGSLHNAKVGNVLRQIFAGWHLYRSS